MHRVKHLEAITAAVQLFSNSVLLSGTPMPKTMSFIKVDATSDFSYHNLPYGIFSTPDNVSDLSLLSCSEFRNKKYVCKCVAYQMQWSS